MAKKLSDLTATPSVKNVFFKKKKLIADEAAAKLEAGAEAGAAAPDTQEVAPAASAESAAAADSNNKAAALLPAEADAGLSSAAWWGIGGAAAIGGGIALSNNGGGGNKNNAVALKAPAASQDPIDQNAESFDVEGQFKITDLDVGNTLSVTVGTPIVAQTSGLPVPEEAGNLTPDLELSEVPLKTTGSDIDVTYTYSPDKINLSFLAEGETLTVTYPVTVSDGASSFVYNVVVTITGTNDAPSVDAEALVDDADEGAAAFEVNLLDKASDVDVTDVLSVVVDSFTYTVVDTVLVEDTGSVEFIVLAEETPLPVLEIEPVPVPVPVEGLPLGLTFDEVANKLTVDATHESFQELAQGDTRVITVNYTITDGSGAENSTVPQSLTITITGTNDVPTVGEQPLTEDYKEDQQNLTVGKTVDSDSEKSLVDSSFAVNLLEGAIDVDNGDSLSVLGNSFTYSVDGDTGEDEPGELPDGLHFDGDANELWVDAADQSFQDLAKDEVRTIVVNYKITDEYEATVNQLLTIKVTGTNDAPVATFSNVSETGFSIQVEDVDNEAVVRLVQPVNSSSSLVDDSESKGFTATKQFTVTAGAVITDQLINVIDEHQAEAAVMARVIQGTNSVDTIDITGATSDTVIYGFNGDDNIVAGAGDDSIYGGAGNDSLVGGAGVDSVIGGDGDDTYVFAQNAEEGDSISDVSGTDTIRTTVANVDLSLLNAGNTLVSAGINRVEIANNGTATFTGAQLSGQSIIINEAPINNDPTTLAINIVGTTAVNFSTLNFNGSGSADFDNNTDRITITGDAESNSITGTGFADSIDGGNGSDSLIGGAGSDTLIGGDGDDTLSGGNGNDSLSGGNGNDTLIGGDGDDRLSGGEGNDTFVYNSIGDGTDTVIGFTTLSDVIDVDAILNVTKAYLESNVNAVDFTATDANVIVFGAGSGITSLSNAATRIANDNEIVSTNGLIVFSNNGNTFVYHSSNLAGNGTETLLLTLQGISNAADLNANDFLFLGPVVS